MRKKEKPPTGVLPIKLGRPLQMPARRLAALLTATQRQCCIARNAVVTRWYVWRKEHPDWKPGDPYEAPPAKTKRKPKETDKEPKDSLIGPRLFLSRDLYGTATEAATMLSGTVASGCSQEVVDLLRKNTPYNHPGDARWNWQAILAHEISLPTWREGTIPCPKSTSKFLYTDDRCELMFSLLSKRTGYKVLSPTVRLEVGDFSPGKRRLLQRIARGDIAMCDSQIAEKGGQWYFNLCYRVPVVASGLPADRILTVKPSLPDDAWPLVLEWMDAESGNPEHWFVGKAKPLIAEYRRVKSRRRAICDRYRDGTGSGHGRQRWYQTIRPLARWVVNAQVRFEKQTVSDIVKRAILEKCGTILYREPTMPVRDVGWWAKQDMPFNWTSFGARLKFAATKAGLAYEVERIRMREWKRTDEKDAG